MRINHNIAALNTYRQLTTNTTNTSNSLEKLSSGLRINRAGDDAAGLAISEKMRSQIRGLDTAARNANDGISLIQTAEGALNETHSILQRMKELAVQASNDTNTASDRAEMQKEINQLTKEIDRIAKDTEFNTKKLLDGSMGAVATLAATTDFADVQIIGELSSGVYNAKISDIVAAKSTVLTSTHDSTLTLNEQFNLGPGTYVLKVTGATGGNATATLYAEDGSTAINGFTGTIDVDAATGLKGIVLTGGGDDADSGEITFTVTADRQISYEVALAGDASGKDYASDFAFTLQDDADVGDTVAITVDATKAIKFHIGANQGQNMSLSINNMGSTTLGVNNLDLTSQTSADAAITTIDTAINRVSAQRANLGAIQNRLEHTVNNLGTTSENLTASESRIRDVDMAKEMMEFTKNNILSQASQAMLAQANQQPQSVLQLLQ